MRASAMTPQSRERDWPGEALLSEMEMGRVAQRLEEEIDLPRSTHGPLVCSKEFPLKRDSRPAQSAMSCCYCPPLPTLISQSQSAKTSSPAGRVVHTPAAFTRRTRLCMENPSRVHLGLIFEPFDLVPRSGGCNRDGGP